MARKASTASQAKKTNTASTAKKASQAKTASKAKKDEAKKAKKANDEEDASTAPAWGKDKRTFERDELKEFISSAMHTCHWMTEHEREMGDCIYEADYIVDRIFDEYKLA